MSTLTDTTPARVIRTTRGRPTSDGAGVKLTRVIGHILQDEKFPGVHVAFGNPYGVHTGADWYSATHIDVVGTRFDIWVDDRQIMSDGKFLID